MKKYGLIGGIIVGLAFFGNTNAEERKAVLYAPEALSAEEQETIANAKYIDENILSFDNLEFDEKGNPVKTQEQSTSQPAKQEDQKKVSVPPSPLSKEKTEEKIKDEQPALEGEQSLTEALKTREESKNEKAETESEKKEETWITKLKEPLTAIGSSLVSGEPPTSTLENLMTNSQEKKEGSNAAVFDISGIMLRMSVSQADMAMQKRGFKKINQEYEIPNFIRWRNEEACRNNGVVGYERIASCVVEMAKKNNYQYIYETKYIKYKTKEEVAVKYTSNFTNNKVYKIIYKSMAPMVSNRGAKAAYLRNIKVYDFWKQINRKYGVPDDQEQITWGLGGNKPYLKASTGILILEDPMLRELDYTRMSREDQLFMNTNLYSF